jgi:hypothetical protein
MSYDPRNEGAQCDRCPLGPRGCLRQGKGAEPWEPVRSERHPTDGYPTASVAAVIESPGEDGARHGYPFAGREGGEWIRGLAAAGLHRSDVDLVSVISCKPPGAPGGAWKRLKHKIDQLRKGGFMNSRRRAHQRRGLWRRQRRRSLILLRAVGPVFYLKSRTIYTS